jgi:hypothetical protein
MALVTLPLKARRERLQQTWGGFQAHPERIAARSLTAEVAASWRRCLGALEPSRLAAPLAVDASLHRAWELSPLRAAANRRLDALVQIAKEGGLLVALSDPEGRLLWTSDSRQMRSRADSVNFVPGARWDERSFGTNAVAMALELRRASQVFAAEHFLPSIHDWVCYAAPIIHPDSREVAGVLDFSTVWERHSPFGLTAVDTLAREIGQLLPAATQPSAPLRIFALGRTPRVLLNGRELALSPRQLEILCVLSLYPEGLSLEAAHTELYGDQPVALVTLKAELSRLRHQLAGAIGSRPYRLTLPVEADFLVVAEALEAGRLTSALSKYRGPLLPRSESPALEEQRNYLEAAIQEAALVCTEVEALHHYCARFGDDAAAVGRLLQLLPGDDPRAATARARLRSSDA